jgi:hypothetical protein
MLSFLAWIMLYIISAARSAATGPAESGTEGGTMNVYIKSKSENEGCARLIKFDAQNDEQKRAAILRIAAQGYNTRVTELTQKEFDMEKREQAKCDASHICYV